MKTTNNKLLDNTGNPVSNNRPMVKRIEYEVDCIREIIWTENKDIAYNSLTKSLTGNTREVERPMNDTEYIEYLENKIESNGLSAAKTAMAQCDRIDELWNENRELKDQLRATNESYSNQLWLMKCGGIEIDKDGYKPINQWRHTKEQLYDIAIKNYELLFIERKLRNNDKDQFLKVVESVFEEHFEYDNYFNIKCNCGYTIDNDFEEHLLQEIRKAMENE